MSKRLTQQAEQTQRILTAQESKIMQYYHLTTFVVTIFASVLLSLILVKWWMPVPRLPLSEKQVRELRLGNAVNKAWEHLSPLEREKILQAERYPATSLNDNCATSKAI